MIKISQRVQDLKASQTIAVAAKAAELKSQGIDVVSLSLGEPDFATPKNICDAATKAMQEGKTHYPPIDGVPELKQAIIAKFKRDNDLNFEANEIIVSTGGKHTIFNLFQAILDKGDEVIIPAPYWTSYPDMAEYCGAKPVTIDTTLEQNFKITTEQLEQTITKNTKLLILNSPSNPTGMLYTKAELLGLAQVLDSNPHVSVMTDDIYEHILLSNDTFYNLLQVAPQLRDRCFVVNGVSKAYAMTGWRIGFVAGPKDVIAAMKKVQSQSTSGACSIAQYAAVEALSGDQTCVTEMTAEFRKRYAYFQPAMSKLDGIICNEPQGAFYLFVNVSEAMQKNGIKTDLEFAGELLNQAHVAAVPGIAFGCENHLRLSFATEMSQLQLAVEKFNEFLTN